MTAKFAEYHCSYRPWREHLSRQTIFTEYYCSYRPYNRENPSKNTIFTEYYCSYHPYNIENIPRKSQEYYCSYITPRERLFTKRRFSQSITAATSLTKDDFHRVLLQPALTRDGFHGSTIATTIPRKTVLTKDGFDKVSWLFLALVLSQPEHSNENTRAFEQLQRKRCQKNRNKEKKNDNRID